MEDFFYTYFIYPIEARTGYNIVNTFVYALIAVISLYIIYRWWEKERISIKPSFVFSALVFVVFGAVKRAITDAVDAGVLQGGIYEIYAYNIWNVSPMIYVYTGLLFVILYFIEQKYRVNYLSFYVGAGIALIHLFLFIPAVKDIIPFLVVGFLAIIPPALFYVFKRNLLYSLVIFSHAFDGAATFYGIEFLGYAEQHVLPSFIGENFGYFAFYLLKILIATAFVLVLEKEDIKKDQELFLLTAASVLGLAPGVRDMLRIAAGV